MRWYRPNERPDRKEWRVVGAKKKKEKTKIKESKERRQSADHPIGWWLYDKKYSRFAASESCWPSGKGKVVLWCHVILHVGANDLKQKELIKGYCRQNWWELIQHRNISEKGLNQGGLHLNIKGNQQFFKKFRVRARSSPWITSELKKRMYDRDILKIKTCKSNDPNDIGRNLKNYAIL